MQIASSGQLMILPRDGGGFFESSMLFRLFEGIPRFFASSEPWRRVVGRCCDRLAVAVVLVTAMTAASRGATTAPSGKAGHNLYQPVSLAEQETKASDQKIQVHYGIPFFNGALPLSSDGIARVVINRRAARVFLLGMTNSEKPRAWPDPRDYSKRFFVGDELGSIRLEYVDGSTQVYPLILGESIWWGTLFYENPEPFSTSEKFRQVLAESLRLYPPAPIEDGEYLATIAPKPIAIRNIVVQDAPAKRGVPVVTAITIEPMDRGDVAGAGALAPGTLTTAVDAFIAEKSLRAAGEDEPGAAARLDGLRRVLYTTDDRFAGHVAAEVPPGYSGPRVSFKGTVFAEILANVFHHNVQDMAAKVDADGMYHTSTKDSLSWGSYNGFGTFRAHLGKYYDSSFSRDMGRSLQELSELGYLDTAARCADYCLRTARLWEEKPNLRFDGITVPRHWGQVINKPGKGSCFENDGHGLTTLFLYKLWQRLPERDAWLRLRWTDVMAAGDWILWQFDHPAISGATDVLHTTGESAARSGYSVYPDYVCMEALLGLARMADSIAERGAAARWRERAGRMRQSISDRYIINDPKYGRVWTLESAGWTHLSTVLGPLIFRADFDGFAPEDDDRDFRAVSAAAYQRLVDNYQPFGFYGQAMGYGQGFVTQSALLLDRMQDATRMLDWAARQIYDPRIGSYIVPEGCQIDPTARYWYRVGDLGNGVQEAEIIKALRLVVGIDDNRQDRLQFFPRLPYEWSEIAVDRYPIVIERAGRVENALLRYKLERAVARMRLTIAASKELGDVAIRLGPFGQPPDPSTLRTNGIRSTGTVVHDGDSWWVKMNAPVGLEECTVEIARHDSVQ
jgi:hypothetical protein